MIETEVRKLVAPTSSAIPAIGNRLYIGNAPTTATYPYAIMYSISRTEPHEAEMPTERIQFSVYSDNLSSATDIAEAIRDRVKRFYGSPTGSTYTLLNCVQQNMIYLYDDINYKHVKILDVLIRYRR